MWLLLVSPWESPSGAWEVCSFPSEGEARAAARRKDLTREHYVLPLEEIVKWLREVMKEEVGDR